MANDGERLMASIKGISDLLPSIGETLRRFKPWLYMDNVLTCRFEDLIGPKGGGTIENQKIILSDISNFIHVPLGEEKLEKIADIVYSGKSSTYRKGKVGDWRNFFDLDHITEFKKEANKEIIAFGYEPTENW